MRDKVVTFLLKAGVRGLVKHRKYTKVVVRAIIAQVEVRDLLLFGVEMRRRIHGNRSNILRRPEKD